MHRVRNLAAFAAKRQKPPTARGFVRRGVFQQKPCRVEFVYWVAQIRIYRVAVVGVLGVWLLAGASVASD